MTDTFIWKAHATSSGGGDFTVSEAKFGDGYSQESEWGINAETQKWSINVGMYHTQMQDVIDFLRAHKGISFYWTPPFSAQGLFRCKGFRPTNQGGGYWTLSAEFYQVFSP